MAVDGVTRDIEEALNKIVNTTEQSGNMRKELKKTIYETVSTLRNLCYIESTALHVYKYIHIMPYQHIQICRTWAPMKNPYLQGSPICNCHLLQI
jgi:hypothetical protein